jgi:hypothetical protein
VVVQHVDVRDGGQAIIGAVHPASLGGKLKERGTTPRAYHHPVPRLSENVARKLGLVDAASERQCANGSDAIFTAENLPALQLEIRLPASMGFTLQSRSHVGERGE